MINNFGDVCSSKESISINEQLKNMYRKWVEKYKDTLDKLSNAEEENYTRPFLLTCNDFFLSHKVMLIGKEANVKNQSWDVTFLEEYLCFDKGGWYDYEEHVLGINDEHSPWKLRKTQYLKTMKIAAGVQENCTDLSCMGLITNNLNKISNNGKYTTTNNQLLNIIYEPFEYNGKNLTILQHEIDILCPQKIIFCIGKGYDSHFIRAFGDKQYQKVAEFIKKLNIHKEPFLNCGAFELWEMGPKMEIAIALHPSSHMTKDIRDIYEEKMKNFVK